MIISHTKAIDVSPYMSDSNFFDELEDENPMKSLMPIFSSFQNIDTIIIKNTMISAENLRYLTMTIVMGKRRRFYKNMRFTKYLDTKIKVKTSICNVVFKDCKMGSWGANGDSFAMYIIQMNYLMKNQFSVCCSGVSGVSSEYLKQGLMIYTVKVLWKCDISNTEFLYSDFVELCSSRTLTSVRLVNTPAFYTILIDYGEDLLKIYQLITNMINDNKIEKLEKYLKKSANDIDTNIKFYFIKKRDELNIEFNVNDSHFLLWRGEYKDSSKNRLNYHIYDILSQTTIKDLLISKNIETKKSPLKLAQKSSTNTLEIVKKYI